MIDKQEIIQGLIERGVLVTKEFLESNELTEEVLEEPPTHLFLQTKKKENFLTQPPSLEPKISVEIVSSYSKPAEKKEVQDFTKYYRARYESLKNILYQRNELQNTISINKILDRGEREKVSLIGIIFKKNWTKNKNLILEVEDFTGRVKIILSHKMNDFAQISERIVFDEVIGVTGVMGNQVIFANALYFPDVPNTKELKKCKDDVNIAFISDIHIGSRLFLKEQFERFIKWTNGEIGTPEQKEEALKLKYLFVVGDAVDGVGIYPGQEEELNISNVYDQYQELVRYFSLIRKDIQIIMCPGNHDAVRIAEPQPPLNNKFTEPLLKLPNLIRVSNPATVNIHRSEHFPGFDILMYHGFSFDYLIANIDYLRKNGGYDRADLIMQFLLQKRHLAPVHSSTQCIPDKERDPLVISKVPDFFVLGHLHKTSIGNYKNISLICSSCWQDKTRFQEKMGHKPEPCLLPLINLNTRKIKLIDFSRGKE